MLVHRFLTLAKVTKIKVDIALAMHLIADILDLNNVDWVVCRTGTTFVMHYLLHQMLVSTTLDIPLALVR